MVCTSPRGIAILILLAVSTGCAHMVESRAIEKFAKNLEKGNLEGLRNATSQEFTDRALRTEVAMDDLRILNIPDGKTSVVKVEELSPTRKRVTAEIAKPGADAKAPKSEIFYEIVKTSSGRWIVDDLFLKQKKQGVVAYKSVSEQLDLLLTVREFLDAWSQGDRGEVLQSASPKLRSVLEQVPPGYLANLTRRVIDPRNRSAHRPQAQLDDTVAVVRIPKPNGETVISLELVEGQWQVIDLAIATKSEADSIPSVYKQALAVATCSQFLDAYEHNDRVRLKELGTSDFYEACLKLSDSREVQLPDATLPEHDLELLTHGSRIDFMLKNPQEVVRVVMMREKEVILDAPPQFRVAEVTRYDIATQQEQRLSSLFTASTVMELFARAISQGELDQVRQLTTRDFSQRIWQQTDIEVFKSLPLQPIQALDLEIVQRHDMGSLTRFEVRQGEYQLTYDLREEHGRFLVDDIHWDLPGRPESVKQTMELLLPVVKFRSAMKMSRELPDSQRAALEALRTYSSADFSRSVWGNVEHVPNSGLSADTFMSANMTSMIQIGDQITIATGDQNFGARIHIIREFERYVIDDVELIAGAGAENRIPLKNSLRKQVIEEQVNRQANAPTGRSRVRQVSDTPAEKSSEKSMSDPLEFSELTEVPERKSTTR